MNTRTPLIASALLAASLISGAAQAALQGRDLNGSIDSFEAYYDTVLDITWLADANYAQTSGYVANGKMLWANANTWAANLSFTDGVHVYDNWRLPNTDASCGSTFSCTGSEMGHLFYIELGGTAGHSILTSADPDLAKFTNLQNYVYWSGAEYALNPELAWVFHMYDGLQYADDKNVAFYAWAVSTGDVSAVPEANTWAMLLAGLGLVGVATRRRKLAKV